MVAAVRVHKYGGPEVLTYEDIEVGAPGQGQVKVKQHACGVNFIDIYFRMGSIRRPSACHSSPATRARAKWPPSVRASPTARSATVSAMSPRALATPGNGWWRPIAP